MTDLVTNPCPVCQGAVEPDRLVKHLYDTHRDRLKPAVFTAHGSWTVPVCPIVAIVGSMPLRAGDRLVVTDSRGRDHGVTLDGGPDGSQ